MGLKMRAYMRKNPKKKNLSGLKLKISIPVTHYHTIKNIVQLQKRVDHFGCPRGWVEHIEQRSNSSMVFFTTLIDESMVMVKINQSLTWSGLCDGILIDNCQELRGMNKRIDNINSLKSSLLRIKTCRVCNGVESKKYIEVLNDEENGTQQNKIGG